MWYIWYQRFENGEHIGSGIWTFSGYKHKSSAVRAAKKRFGNPEKYKWIVAKENPYAKQISQAM